ncbi:uncharacterized protein B0J16DRAFT_113098 [Fusarium flagelliforme]|uniref:uncharacterized protein n=1 Tax=Fusarium flagelliforme TaxID=2675880 RepID=UPI001E8E0819|nr:uncharacterized protein B0J16DRAFT_113098 [Fusarium flagelliforme]KAH7189349.1 hypothetical protein B0J16DRAFT_113098 [Fusarium flagelliforme]
MDAIFTHLPLQHFSALPIAAHTSHLSNMPQHAQSAISRGRPSDAQRKPYSPVLCSCMSCLALHGPSAGLHNDILLFFIKSPLCCVDYKGCISLQRYPAEKE